MHNDHFSRHAQQVLTVARGQDLSHGPASDPSIARSWLRCLEQHRLDPGHAVAPSVLEHARILERREPLQDVLEIASGEMNSLHRQLAASGNAVLLTDARGVTVDFLGDLVFEPFCGSGTQIVAAERTGRRCCAVELDPAYCDVAVRRWEMATGRTASRD